QEDQRNDRRFPANTGPLAIHRREQRHARRSRQATFGALRGRSGAHEFRVLRPRDHAHQAGAVATLRWRQGPAVNDPGLTRFEAFKDDETKARYMAAYDALLARWPVPFEERYVPTRFGVTHVVVSGAPDAPPLV